MLVTNFFFFFKQKTAYEIVSGDWSSDVCSSDLWRSGAAEEAAGGSVSAFQGRRATVGSSLEAGRLRLQQRLLGRRRGGVRLSGAAKRYPLGCRAGNGGKKRQPGSTLAERSSPALARRARQIPSARALRRMRRNGSNAGLHVTLFGSNRVTCHFALLP